VYGNELHPPGILHVLDLRLVAVDDQHGDGVVAVDVAGAAVALDPDLRDLLDLAPLAQGD
jgi:hypothetical protein